ncbi:MAG: DUF2764 family protein [Chlamydiales bacterium]
MTEYYFLASLLPPLEIGHLPSLPFKELKELMWVNLDREDRKMVHDFLRLIDIENLRLFWADEPIDTRGNFTQTEFEQALTDMAWSEMEEFPDYLVDYLEKYQTDEARLWHFQKLLTNFYVEMEGRAEGFIQEYVTFQHEWQLVLLGFRVKKLGRDISTELRYEDASNPIVAQILAQKDAVIYEPPFEYKELKHVFEEKSAVSLDLHKALCEYQFNVIVERWGQEHFAIDHILNYMARLLLVEKWQELDVQKGIEVIDTVEGKIR